MLFFLSSFHALQPQEMAYFFTNPMIPPLTYLQITSSVLQLVIRVLVNLSVYLISTIAFLLNILVSIHIKIIHRNAKPSAMLSDTTFFLLQPWHFLCTPASASVSISVHRVKLNPKALEGLSYTSIRQCLKFVLAYCLNGVTVSMCSGGP